MKKKRVVIDASSALPFPDHYLSGIGRTTVELVRAFERQEDLPVDIGLFAQRASSERLQEYGFSFPTRYLPFPRWNTFEWVRKKTPAVEMLTGADLLHIPHNYAPVFNPDKSVVTIHDAMFLSSPEAHLHDSAMARNVIGLGQTCRAIITCSNSSKKDLVEYGQIPPEKIHICYWGYDKAAFYLIEDHESVRRNLLEWFKIDWPFFFCVSCSAGRKNSPFVIRQFLDLAEEGGQNHLVMVWRNPPEEIQSLIANHPFGQRIHLIAGVTDEELRFLYNGATALLFPSSYEGFGLPVLEAMACGTPVVTCNVSSLPEVGGEAAIYICPGDNNDLLRVMRGFEDDVFDVQKLRQKSLAQAAGFSWELCAKKTVDVYLSCL